MGSWTFDAPTGTFRNHALSSNIRMAAIADTQAMRFLTPERGYGKGRGASVTITRMKNLPIAGRVSEQEHLPTGTPVVDTIQKAVAEWGFKIEGTKFEADLTHFDLRDRRQQKLRDQMSLTMDKMGYDGFKATRTKAIGVAAGAAGVTFETVAAATDPATVTALVNMDVGHIRAIFDFMHGDLKIPPFRNGMYVGILSTKPARGLKSDAEYKDWLAPTTSQPFVSGQLKDFERFMLIETNHFDGLDNTIGSGSVGGEAIFFGADGGFLAVVEDPELRVGVSMDLGRFREFGWLGTIEAGNVWGDDANNSRVIHWTSA